MRSFYQFSPIITKLNFCATFLINTIFIILKLIYTRAITGTYRKMLVTFAVTCTIFAALENISQPYTHNFNGGLAYYSLNESSIFSQKLLQITITIYSACYFTQIGFIALQFLFRYFIVTQHALTRSFKGWKQVFWLFYLLVFGFAYGTLLHYCLIPDDYSDAYMREELKTVYQKVIEDTPRLLAVAYENGRIRHGNALFLIFGSVLISVQYAIIFYCGFRMRELMKKALSNGHVSTKNQNLERQFLNALAVQILLPTVLLTIPVSLVIILPLLDLHISLPTGVMFVLYSFYPPLDTIASMMIIREYRTGVLELLKDILIWIRDRLEDNEENMETTARSL